MFNYFAAYISKFQTKLERKFCASFEKYLFLNTEHRAREALLYI